MRRRTGGSKVPGMFLLLLLAALPPTMAADTPGVPLPPGPALDLLLRRASMYEKAAVRFSCDETVIEGKFSSRTGENKREETTRYRYLYEGDPGSGFREMRFPLGEGGDAREDRSVDPGLPVPGAYEWALLFTELHRPYFRFEPAGEEMVGFHSARIIAFSGAAAWDGGRKIEEWSGKAWVDGETGNFVKIEAAPNHQDELLPLRTTKWLRGVRLGGIPLKKQPRGYRYQLSFTVEKFGLSFPGEAVTRLFVVTPLGEEEIRRRITQKFRDYVFFDVHSEEEFLGATPAPAPPPRP